MSDIEVDDDDIEDLFDESKFDGLAPSDELVSDVNLIISMLVRTATEAHRTRGFAMLRRIVDTAGSGRHEKLSFVLKNMLPCFLMREDLIRVPQVSAPSKSMQTNRTMALSLFLSLLKAYPDLATAEPVDHDSMDVDQPTDENTSSENVSAAESSKSPVKLEPYHPTLSLLQRLCIHCVDKAEWRRGSVDCVASILDAVPEIATPFLSFLTSTIFTAQNAHYRQLASDLCICFLENSLNIDPAMILVAAAGRTRDSVPTVRCQAVKALGLCVLQLTRRGVDWQGILPISDILKRCVCDEKPTVRRAALASFYDCVIECVELKKNLLDLEILKKCASDESILVRKAAIVSISHLLNFFKDEMDLEISTLWAGCVLPLIVDPEQTAAELAVETINSILFNEIANLRKHGNLSAGVRGVLSCIGMNHEHGEFLQRALRLHAKKAAAGIKMLADALSRLLPLEDDINVERTLWLLLEEAAGLAPSQSLTTLAVESWKTSKSSNSAKAALRLLLQLPKSQSKELADELARNLLNFQYPPDMISITTRALFALDPVLGESVVVKISREVDKELHAFVSLGIGLDDDKLIRMVTTIGDLSLVSKREFPARIDPLLQTLGTNTVFIDGTHHSLSPKIRATTFAAFGKMCLMKEATAKKGIDILAIHLNKDDAPEVRNNIIILFGDLCVQYTALVDRFLPLLTSFLKEPNILLRRQVLQVLSSLLAEDFIKFKGSIVYRFLYALSDSDPEIRSIVEAVFSRLVLQRQPQMFRNIFPDTICAINGFTKHKSYRGAEGNRDFYLTNSPLHREKIYRFMLDTLPDAVSKFQISNEIAQHLIAAFAEETVPLPQSDGDPGNQVIIDALALLGSKELRVTGGRLFTEVEVEGEGVAEKEKDVLAKTHRKNVQDNIVPVLLQLKTLMEEKRSPLIRKLRSTLMNVLRDFKDDLSTILSSDPLLAEEMRFDLQQEANRRAVVFSLCE